MVVRDGAIWAGNCHAPVLSNLAETSGTIIQALVNHVTTAPEVWLNRCLVTNFTVARNFDRFELRNRKAISLLEFSCGYSFASGVLGFSLY